MNLQPAVLALDIGTTKICAVVVAQDGAVLASAARANDAQVPVGRRGRAEQSPSRIRELGFAAAREAVERATAARPGGDAAIRAIGLTGQMHGILCVDAANAPLSNLITWQDQRCEEPAPGGGTWLEQMLARVPAAMWEPCGCRPASGYLGATLYWMRGGEREESTERNSPQRRRDTERKESKKENQKESQKDAGEGGERGGALVRAARVCMVADWLTAVLTGELPVTDPSHAASAGVFDLVKMRWHDELLSALDLPAKVLPPVRPTGEIIGRLTAPAAAELGVPAGTPVCNALGDHSASVLGAVYGSGAESDGTLVVNLGTGGQICWAIPGFARVAGLETRYLPRAIGPAARSVDDGAPSAMDGYMLVGASLCGGRAYEWLNDVVRDWLGALCEDVLQPGEPRDAALREAVYERTNALAAAAAADCGGLLANTRLAGTRAAPQQRGGLAGIALDNFTLGNVARAVLKGMVAELAELYEGAGTLQKPRLIVMCGNAVRKNPLLREIAAERFGVPVRMPRHGEEAAVGAALVSGVGAGIWPELAAAGRCLVGDGSRGLNSAETP